MQHIQHSKIVGSQHRDNLPSDLCVGEQLLFEWQPDNHFASRLPGTDFFAAVKVLRKSDNTHLGYLPDLSSGSQTAQVVAGHLAQGGGIWGQLSELTGGTPSAPTRGYNIRFQLLGGKAMPRFGKPGTGAKVAAGVYLAVLTGFADKRMPAGQFSSEPQDGVDWQFDVTIEDETVKMSKWTTFAVGEKSNAYANFKALNSGKEWMKANDTSFDWDQAIGRQCYAEVIEKDNGWSSIKALIPIIGGGVAAVTSNKTAAAAPAPAAQKAAPAAAAAAAAPEPDAKPSAQDFIQLKKAAEAGGKSWADLTTVAKSYGKASPSQMTYADIELACMELEILNPFEAVPV